MLEAQVSAPVPGRLLAAKEVAMILRVSIRTVRRLIADGTLPAVRIGRAVRVSQSAVAELIEDNT